MSYEPAFVQEYLYTELEKVERAIETEVLAIRTKNMMLFRLERLRGLLTERAVLERVWRDLSGIGALRQFR